MSRIRPYGANPKDSAAFLLALHAQSLGFAFAAGGQFMRASCGQRDCRKLGLTSGWNGAVGSIRVGRQYRTSEIAREYRDHAPHPASRTFKQDCLRIDGVHSKAWPCAGNLDGWGRGAAPAITA